MGLSKSIYFDYAAATPMDPKVAQAMAPYYRDQFYNASALYQPAREVRQDLEKARAQVAEILAARPAEIIFTAGATESLNLAIRGILAANRGNIVTTAAEHQAVLKSAQASGAKVKICPLKPGGLVDLDKLERMIDDYTVLVSVQYANNEVGTIQPIQRISQIVKKKLIQRKTHQPLYLHSDGSQAPNYLPLQVNRLGVDLLTLNGSKIYGPKYSGCLYVRQGTKILPLIVGGNQERGLRGGTESVASSIGFAQALSIVQAQRSKEAARLTKLQAYLLQKIFAELVNVQLNGVAKPRLPNNVNLSIHGVSGETLVHYLDQAGFLVATGAACEGTQDEPSATLLAIGLDKASANSSIRISMGQHTTKTQIDRFVLILKKTVELLRSRP